MRRWSEEGDGKLTSVGGSENQRTKDDPQLELAYIHRL